jgi:C1A family cysteine protease
MTTPANILIAILLAGSFGALGQGVRAVAGLKKMNDDAAKQNANSADLFIAARLVVSLLIGFLAGIAAGVALGLDKILNINSSNIDVLLGIAAAGYAGTDFLESFAPTIIRRTPPTASRAQAGLGQTQAPKPSATISAELQELKATVTRLEEQVSRLSSHQLPGRISRLPKTGKLRARPLYFGARLDMPDHRDLLYSATSQPLEQQSILPRSIDLRPLCPPVYDQAPFNSCTANAIAGLLEFDRKKQQLFDFAPSRLFIYYNLRSLEGTVGQDLGGAIRDGIKAVADDGYCSETEWPYNPDLLTQAPSPDCYREAVSYKDISYERLDNSDVEGLKTCLAAGFPFAFNFTIYNSFYTADYNVDLGVVPMPDATESPLNVHAACAVGYDDDRAVFIVRNSWGPAHGDQGHYYMPYQYLIGSLARDFWTIRTVT